MASASDDFNRSDGALGSNWAALTSYPGMQISANQAVATIGAYNFAFWNAVAFGNDQYSQAVARNGTNSEAGVICRAIAADKCYFFDYSTNTGNAFLFLLNAGAGFSTLKSFGAVVNVGDTMKIEAIGNQIKCYVNGVQVGTTATDSTLTSGSPGIAGAVGVGAGAVDDWVGADIGGSGIVIPVLSNTYRQMRG